MTAAARSTELKGAKITSTGMSKALFVQSYIFHSSRIPTMQSPVYTLAGIASAAVTDKSRSAVAGAPMRNKRNRWVK